MKLKHTIQNSVILTILSFSTLASASKDFINCPSVQNIKDASSKLDKVSPVAGKYSVTTTNVAFMDEYNQFWCVGDYIAAKDSDDALVQSKDNVANTSSRVGPYADHNLCYYQGKVTAVYAMVAIDDGGVVRC